PRHPAALLIDRDERRQLRRAALRDPLAKPCHLLAVGDVPGKQDHPPALATFEGGRERRRQIVAVEAADQKLSAKPDQVEVVVHGLGAQAGSSMSFLAASVISAKMSLSSLAFGPSTIRRSFGSVPLQRTSTRPSFPSFSSTSWICLDSRGI